MPHGPEGTRLGYVIFTTIKAEGLTLVHASDAQGPIARAAVEYISKASPDLLIISGPPTYLGERGGDAERAIWGLSEVVKNMPERSTAIVDHHLLRDLSYRRVLERVAEASGARERGIRVITAAEYMGLPVSQLEAMRRELWKARQYS